ncbi:hypothetical protein Naga_100005g64 [Nannochloropsis gaditana]|uniref:Uncharacterized protein n=1 Tax=Nannochloropsis gaditana TaxID=72520 RepID=W7TXL6_9STRA|nr:hypothetical protein Naga_100005g64 [Nannochloropsis gaditana]
MIAKRACVIYIQRKAQQLSIYPGRSAILLFKDNIFLLTILPSGIVQMLRRVIRVSLQGISQLARMDNLEIFHRPQPKLPPHRLLQSRRRHHNTGWTAPIRFGPRQKQLARQHGCIVVVVAMEVIGPLHSKALIDLKQAEFR